MISIVRGRSELDLAGAAPERGALFRHRDLTNGAVPPLQLYIVGEYPTKPGRYIFLCTATNVRCVLCGAAEFMTCNGEVSQWVRWPHKIAAGLYSLKFTPNLSYVTRAILTSSETSLYRSNHVNRYAIMCLQTSSDLGTGPATVLIELD